MPSVTLNAIAVSALLATTHAFIPLSIDPLPTDLDTNVWKPMATLAPIPVITPPPSATHTGKEEEEIYSDLLVQILPIDGLRKRQGAPIANPQAGAAPQVTQVSPITTYLIQSGANQVPIVYTQTFADIPDQWPSPVPGTIGLGTIQGEVGVIRTRAKREVPTQAPMGGGQGLEWKGRIPAKEEWSSLEKEGRKNPESTDDVPLENKAKTSAIEESLPLDKETKKEPITVGDDTTPLTLESKKEPLTEDSPILAKKVKEVLQGSTTDQSGNPEGSSSDARVLKAGTLAVLAVSIGTICVTLL